MKAKLILFLIVSLFASCSTEYMNIDKDQSNQVLLLKVGYISNKFEGGTILNFPTEKDSFSIVVDYKAPGDFGNILLTYKELNMPLFSGSIIWMGTGEMSFPAKLSPKDKFKAVLTNDYIIPVNGFENVFNPGEVEYDYNKVWRSIQNLTIVRRFLQTNPRQTIKLFLYTPSVGIGNPDDWYWVVFVKKNQLYEL